MSRLALLTLRTVGSDRLKGSPAANRATISMLYSCTPQAAAVLGAGSATRFFPFVADFLLSPEFICYVLGGFGPACRDQPGPRLLPCPSAVARKMLFTFVHIRTPFQKWECSEYNSKSDVWLQNLPVPVAPSFSLPGQPAPFSSVVMRPR